MSAAFLVVALASALADTPRRVVIVLGLQGFVLTTVFGKAYSLVPSYFDRTLAWPRALAVHLPLTTVGVCCLALGWVTGPAWLDAAGALAWCLGVLVFLVTLLVTVRNNLTGHETGTGGTETDRRRVDRLANAFVPVALGYLLAGSYELLAGTTRLPPLLDGTYPRVAHLLATGFALLVLFAVGFRLLPRFFSVPSPGRFAVVVLPLGAVGPALVATGLPAGPLLHAGAGALATAVVGFALAYLLLVTRTDRERVGFYGPLAGVCFGVAGVTLGVWFAVRGLAGGLAVAHARVNVFGLLGVTIVGVVYQFYPPAVARWPFAGDRLALGSLVVLAAGIALWALGAAGPVVVETAGNALALGGALAFFYLLAGTIHGQASRR